MRLNLWMIANRLYELEPEIQIPEDAPVNLRSARRAYADNCVYVYQKNRNVICDAGTEGGRLIFRDAACDQIFEMVQFAFDFYDDWFTEMLDCVEENDYKTLVDKSWQVFHNPILLLDGANRLLARSGQYREDEVNYDWAYLCRHGCSAVSVIQYLMENGRHQDFYSGEKAQIYSFPENAYVSTEVSAVIRKKERTLGRLNILQKDRKLNPGDIYMADRLVKFLLPVLDDLNEAGGNVQMLYPVLGKLLLGQPVNDAETDFWKAYTGWKPEDSQRVVVLCPEKKRIRMEEMFLICNLLQNALPGCIATQVDGVIGFICNLPEPVQLLWESLDEILCRFQLTAGFSSSFRGMENLPCYYDQARAAVRLGRAADSERIFYEFYPCALDYLLLSNSFEKSLCAVHPDIRKLWETGKRDGGSWIETLRIYLEEDRSLLHTAERLYIHRSTLVYRIGKLTDKMQANLERAYDRDYLKASIRVMRLYEQRKIAAAMEKSGEMQENPF